MRILNSWQLEGLPRALLVGGDAVHAVGHQLQPARVGQLLLDLLDGLVAHVAAGGHLGVGLELLARVDLQVLDAHARRLVHRLEEAQHAEGVALQRQLQAQLLRSGIVALGGDRVVGGARQRHRQQHRSGEDG
jgi:hypothetical protein